MKKLGLIILFTALMVGCKGKAQKSEANSNSMAVAQPEKVKDHNFPIQKSDAQWKKELTLQQYNILREAGTEPPRSSPLLHIEGKGVFVCAADGNPVFLNKNQFVSGTGWPSFDRPVKGGVLLATDTKLGYKRDEVICSVCGGHLGHRFNDGPKETTGLRYCMDGAGMKFIKADNKSENEIIKEQDMKVKKEIKANKMMAKKK